MDKVSENPFKNRNKSGTPLMVVTALFVTLYLVSNVMAVKIVDIADLFYFDAGTIIFPFAYMLGDVLTEIWGYRTARRIIWLAFVCNIILVACTQIAVWLPSPEHLTDGAEAYARVFNFVPRIVLGSLAGFLLGELSNAWFMAKIKVLTRGRWLWARTIGSSAIGFVFDTVPFVLIAFLGVLTARELMLMMAFQYCAKLLIEAIAGTPLAYAAIRIISKHFSVNK